MKANVKRRVMAWILAGAMTLSQCPTSIYASEGEPAATEQTTESAEERKAAEEEAAKKAAEEEAKAAAESEAAAKAAAEEAAKKAESEAAAKAEAEAKAKAESEAAAKAAQEADKQTETAAPEETAAPTETSAVEDTKAEEDTSAETQAEAEESESQSEVGETVPQESSETVTEAQSEKVTEAATEVATETVTEEETESLTEEETEEETEKERTRTVYTYEDGSLRVTARLSDPKAIPDEAVLRVTAVTPGVAGYDAYMAALNGAMSDGETVYNEENTLLYDIAFMGDRLDEDGKAIEDGGQVEYQLEAGTVSISIVHKQDQLSDQLGAESAKDVEVVHLPLTDAVRDSVDSTLDAGGISAGDVQVEPVGASVSLNGTDRTSFSLSGLSVVAEYTADNGVTYNVPGTKDNTDFVNLRSILNKSIEYGIVANTYKQQNHAQTNFAVINYERDGSNVLEPDLSGLGKVPFIVGSITTNLRFGGSTSGKQQTTFDIYTANDVTDGQISSDNTTTVNVNIVRDDKSKVIAEVQAKIDDMKKVSQELAKHTSTVNTLASTQDPNGFELDFTKYDDNQVIYVDVNDEKEWGQYKDKLTTAIFERTNGLRIKKNPNQIIVFNVKAAGDVKINKFSVNGVETDSEITSGEKNTNLDTLTARTIVWNIINAKKVNLDTMAGVVLAPQDDVEISVKGSAGWITTAGTVKNTDGEYHFIYQDRNYAKGDAATIKVEKQFNGTWPESGFKFQLTSTLGTPMPSSNEVTATSTNPSPSFGEIKYKLNAAGTQTYTYTLSEVLPNGVTATNPTKDGITYDTSTYTVEVKVTATEKKVTNQQGGIDTTVTTVVDSITYKKGNEIISTPTFNNTQTSTTVSRTVEKVWEDANGNEISAPANTTVTFNLFANNDTTPVRTVTLPTANGAWSTTVDGLSDGKNYRWEEVTPAGYTSTQTTTGITTKFTNTRQEDTDEKPASVTLNKQDEEGNALKGAIFSVYADEKAEGNVLKTYTAGTATISTKDFPKNNLPEVGKTSTLYLKETTAPTGYKLDGTIYKLEMGASQQSGWNADNTKYVTTTSYSLRIDGKTSVDVTNKKDTEGKKTYEKVTLNKQDEEGKALKGAIFSVYADEKAEGDVLKTYTAGTATISAEDFMENLPEVGKTSTLYLKETTAPTGYKLDGTIYKLEMGASQQSGWNADNTKYVTTTSYSLRIDGKTSVDVTNKKDTAETKVSNDLTLTKTDEGTTALDGAEFAVYEDQAGTKSLNKTYTTSEGGKVTIKASDFEGAVDKTTPEKTLYLKETKAPAGYQLGTTVYELKLTYAEKEELDQTTNKFVTTKTYSLKNGDKAELTVTNKKDTEETEVYNEVTLTKTDDEKNALDGAEFTVYADEAATESLRTYTAGTVKISAKDFLNKLPKVGERTALYVKETKAPAGYKLSDEVYNLVISANQVEGWNKDHTKYVTTTTYGLTIDGNAEKEIVNKKDTGDDVKYGKVTLNKEDGAKKALEGAEFTVYADEAGTESLKTYTAGSATISAEDFLNNLPKVGEKTTLYVKETKAPAGYKLGTDSYKLEISASEAKDWNADHTKYVTTVTYGLTIDGQNSKTAINEQTSVKISKVDILDNSKELEGAMLEIRDKDDNLVEKWTSDKTSHEVKGLKTGEKYTLKETVAPDGYSITTATEFVLKEDGTVDKEKTTTKGREDGVLLVEDKQTSVKISKVDILDNSKELEGAMLEIRDKDGNLVEKWTSDKTSHEVKGLKTGEKYTLKETVAPNGYDITTDTEFVLKEDGTVDTEKTTTKRRADGVLLVEDDLLARDLYADKIDPSGNSLKGAGLAVYAVENGARAAKAQDSWTSDGKAHGLKLKAGTYDLVETKAPAGYKLADAIRFTVALDGKVTRADGTANGTLNGAPVIVMEDATERGVKNQSFAKVDEYGRGVVGASMEIRTEEGNVIASWTTDGQLHEESLPAGTYVLSETAAPAGYKLADNISFTVDAKGNVTSGSTKVKGVNANVAMVDDFESALTVKISKQDVAGNEIAGAALQLLDTDGNELIAWTTEKDTVTEVELPAGTYVLHEVSAPKGYQVAADITFTVAADGTVTVKGDAENGKNGVVIMVDKQVDSVHKDNKQDNKKDNKAVKTGDNTPVAGMFLAMMISAAVILMTSKRRKKEEA